MASGKRASMREGPLAALFRKTEEEGAEERRARGGRAREPVERRARRAPVGAQRPRRGRARRPRPRARRPSPSPSPPSAPAASSRYEGVPTPEERLRYGLLRRTSPRTSWSARPSRASAPRPRSRRSRSTRPQSPLHREPVLRVVGVGGAGVNAVNRMIEAQVEGVEFIAVNTDLQSLEQSSAPTRVHIGDDATRGLGSGADPELGPPGGDRGVRRAQGACSRARTWSSSPPAPAAAPARARRPWWRGSRARSARSPSGIVTKPFALRGRAPRRAGRRRASRSWPPRSTRSSRSRTRACSSVLDKKTSMVEAFRVADDVLRQGVQGISDLITLPGLINLDFADVRTIMSEAGNALLGHRHGHRREPRARRRVARGRVAAARDLGRGRPVDPAVDHRRRATCRCGRSTRPPRRWPRPPTPTPTSSSARWSTRSSRTRSGSRSWPPATATRPRRAASADRRELAPRTPTTSRGSPARRGASAARQRRARTTSTCRSSSARER